MFGAGFTRIFMGGQTLGKNANSNNNKTTAPIPVSAATLHSSGAHSFAHLAGSAGNNTSNVAYSGKAGNLFPAYLSSTDSGLKSGSSYSVNLNNNGKVNNGYVNPMPVVSGAGRQYYASTDLMMVRSPKVSAKNNQEMTPNTIYK